MIQLEGVWSLYDMKCTIYKNTISLSTVILIKYTFKKISRNIMVNLYDKMLYSIIYFL